MTAVVRIDRLTEAPIVGRYYLVPTVAYPWHGRVANWPVFLPLHEDADHLNFPYPHYHIDSRFVAAGEWRRAQDNIYENAAARFQVSPLHTIGEPLAPLVWRRLRCKREMPGYFFGEREPIQKLRAAYAGQQCKHGKAGWICPHRNFVLGSIPAVDGVITCPGHGLRICAASGKVL